MEALEQSLSHPYADMVLIYLDPSHWELALLGAGLEVELLGCFCLPLSHAQPSLGFVCREVWMG